MKYLVMSREALDFLKEVTDLAEKIIWKMHPSKNPEIAPVDAFLFFFLQRAVNIGKSTALLIENKQYQDAWAIARIAFEGRYFVLKFLIDPSIANKWVSFYVLEKYREEYDLHDEAAAKKMLASEFSTDAVARAKAEFGGAFKDRQLKPKWHTYHSVAKLVEELKEKKLLKDTDHPMFYGTYSEVVHWAPLGIIDAEKYIGAVIGTTFTFILEMSITVNSEFVLGSENDIADVQRRYVECARRATPA
jgi:hypothetical protein